MDRMRTGRHLEWEGSFNARDLGGLRTATGRETRWGSLVRSDELDHLTDTGWAALHAYGIRTIVDLRNDEERDSRVRQPPEDITTVQVPLDDLADVEFWDYARKHELDGTPLYFQPFLDGKAERCAAALTAIARAGPGGVVFHCGGGRDRTGLVSLLVLAVAEVVSDDIVADYELSNLRLPAFWAARGWEDQRPMIDDILKRKGTSARDLLLEILRSLDVKEFLLSAGLEEDDLAALRQRLLGPGRKHRLPGGGSADRLRRFRFAGSAPARAVWRRDWDQSPRRLRSVGRSSSSWPARRRRCH